MQRLSRFSVLSALLLMTLAPAAFAGAKGSNVFALQFTNGTADLYDLGAPGGLPAANYASAYDHSELGVQLEVWHFMTDEYATTVAFGSGFFSETDKPGNGAAASAKDFAYSQSSFNIRIGGDRVVHLNERSLIYFGPGIEYWSGKSKFDWGAGDTRNYETGNVTRYSLSGRIGTTMMLGKTVGIGGHLGHRIGMATVDDRGRKITWWPTSFDGAGGLVFSFGS